jgi:glutamate dehydrogenase
MDVTNSVDDTAPPEDLAAQARRSGVATVSWKAEESGLRCVVGWPGARPELAEVLPLFEHLGLRLLDHHPVGLADPEGDVFLFGGVTPQHDEEVTSLLGESFLAAWERRCDRDAFSALAANARLHARQVQLLRVAFAYLRQAGLGASRRYVQDILLRHPVFVRRWVELFEARFDPRRPEVLPDDLDDLVEVATTRDEDKVLRWYVGFARAVTRTNYFRRDIDDAHAATIVVKLDPSAMPFLQQPVPWVETFVHHPDVEGIHIRYGRTARGGVRWSDRLEDYRAEVLALVKAQQVKNALIVPAGAKGAFVVKRPVAELGRAGAERQLRRCYRLFVRGLLEVTDNVVGGSVQHPPDTVTLDADDPYLVVAADKGTAAFSDLANAEANEVGFWLGDAFASGGGTGYDHKRLGVTARGAWVSVRRHFAELGLDVDRDPFTVVGIGDMSGDVFGNGMLLSETIQLVAAFDHRHIFLDPDPDPGASYQERKRLAAMAPSSWADYDAESLSPGGGVYPRSATFVPLSPQVRRRLRLEATRLAPDDVVKAVLRAPVDLLWNGGIGTYVRASHESNGQVGDRANDRVRVAAEELRCRVVAEGGNLGLTQSARIEYALAGGRINADFIDNAAGVNTSDREVNLKVLFAKPVQTGTLSSVERDALLAECAEEVVRAVLADNTRQTLAISVAEAHGPFLLDRHERVMRNLEDLAGLDRTREQLPSDEEIARRRAAGTGLVRPEIAVLLAHAKNLVHTELAESDLPDDPGLSKVLNDYFPAGLRARFHSEISGHELAREIICTRLANDVIDRLGPGFLYRLEDRTGAATPRSLRAYLVVRDLLDVEALWEGLDMSLPLTETMPLRREIERSLEHNVCWLLRRSADSSDVERQREALGEHVGQLQRWVEESAAETPGAGLPENAQALRAAGVPAALARRLAALRLLLPVLELAAVAAETDTEVTALAARYFEVGQELDLTRLTESLSIEPTDTHFTQLAKSALADELCTVQVQLARDLLRLGGVTAWAAAHHDRLRRVHALYADIAAAGEPDFAATTLAIQTLRDLLHAPGSTGPQR